MRVEIKRNKGSAAILITFDTVKENFESASERNRFFWELYGRKQVVIKDSGRYEYDREGLMDEIPHLKVSDSVFIIMQEHMKRMMQFFDEWEDKVEFDTFPVILNKKRLHELEESEVESE